MSCFKKRVHFTVCSVIIFTITTVAQATEVGLFSTTSVYNGIISNTAQSVSKTGSSINFKTQPNIDASLPIFLNFNKNLATLGNFELRMHASLQDLSFRAVSENGISLQANGININFVDPITLNVSGARAAIGPELRYHFTPSFFFSQRVIFSYADYNIKTHIGDWVLRDKYDFSDVQTELGLSYELLKKQNNSVRLGCAVIDLLRGLDLHCIAGLYYHFR